MTLRRGQYGLIVAGPGTGKSSLSLAVALTMAEHDVSTLYFSPDSDAFTQVSRALSNRSGLPLAESERYARGEDVHPDTLDQAAKLLGLPIRFSFDPAPDLDSIETTVNAFEELYGEYPGLMVIDNITDVRNGTADNGDDPFSGLESFNGFAHTMARETQACVIGLHHSTGPYNDGNKPIPMSGVKGQIGRVPEFIWTMFTPQPGRLGVSAVKNRGGKKDASGETYAELEFDGATMTIADIPVYEGSDSPYRENSAPEGSDTGDPFQPVSDDLRRVYEEGMG
jgi:hypothetical protein